MAVNALAAIDFPALVGLDVVDGTKASIIQKNTLGGVWFLLWRYCVDIVFNVFIAEFLNKLLLGQAKVLRRDRHLIGDKPSRLTRAAFPALFAIAPMFLARRHMRVHTASALTSQFY